MKRSPQSLICLGLGAFLPCGAAIVAPNLSYVAGVIRRRQQPDYLVLPN
jgi:hypothetical protein